MAQTGAPLHGPRDSGFTAGPLPLGHSCTVSIAVVLPSPRASQGIDSPPPYSCDCSLTHISTAWYGTFLGTCGGSSTPILQHSLFYAPDNLKQSAGEMHVCTDFVGQLLLLSVAQHLRGVSTSCWTRSHTQRQTTQSKGAHTLQREAREGNGPHGTTATCAAGRLAH